MTSLHLPLITCSTQRQFTFQIYMETRWRQCLRHNFSLSSYNITGHPIDLLYIFHYLSTSLSMSPSLYLSSIPSLRLCVLSIKCKFAFIHQFKHLLRIAEFHILIWFVFSLHLLFLYSYYTLTYFWSWWRFNLNSSVVGFTLKRMETYYSRICYNLIEVG